MSSLPSTVSKRTIDTSHLFLLLGAALLRFVNLGFIDLQAWDEALYAVRAQAIATASLWLDQSSLAIGGLYSALHPPLQVWGTALAFILFGQSEFSARIVSAVAGGVTVFVIYFMGKELGSKRVALTAALLFSLTPIVTFYSRQGQFDTLLTLFLTLSVLYLVRLSKASSSKTAILAGLFTGLALMTKLFVGTGIPIVYAIWILFGKPLDSKQHWHQLIIVMATAFVFASPWHIYMTYLHGNGDPLFFLESSAIVSRAFTGIEGNVKSLELLYYVNQLIVLFPFGTAAFLVGFSKTYRQPLGPWHLPAIWFGLFFLVFSVMRTKLAVYALPMLVPASLFAGQALENSANGIYKNRTSLFLIFGTVFSLIWSSNQVIRSAIKGMIASSVSFELPSSADARGFLLFVLLTVFGIFLPWLFLKGRRIDLFKPHFPSIVLLALFALSAFSVVVLDRRQYDDGATALAAFIDRSDISNIVVAGFDRNPQLTYYLKGADIGWRDDLRVRRIIPPADSLYYRQWINKEMEGEPSTTLLLIEKDKFVRYETIDPSRFLSGSFVRIFESRRYAAYVSGQFDILAQNSLTGTGSDSRLF